LKYVGSYQYRSVTFKAELMLDWYLKTKTSNANSDVIYPYAILSVSEKYIFKSELSVNHYLLQVLTLVKIICSKVA